MRRPSILDPLLGALGARDPMFEGGFGDARALDGRLATVGEPIAREMNVGPSIRRGGTVVRDVTFSSPWASELPSLVGTAHVRWLTAASPPRQRAVRSAVIVLAASREEGFRVREWMWGSLAARHGVDVVLLENAFYGARRAPGQRSASLATVADQLRMNLATIAEVGTLIAWLEREGHDRLAVAGFSMGGAIAALVGALVRRPIAVVPAAAGLSPAPIYTVGLLSKSVAWPALAREASGDARAELGAMLETASLGRLAPPVVRDAAIVLGCTRDGFVSRAETEALARHWSAELRWIPGGHVSGLALGARAMRRATLDALGRLPAPQWAFANT